MCKCDCRCIIALLGAGALFILAFTLSRWIESLWLQGDDAYITYQYARRLAAGEGFTFSPGAPPTYGSTTPLWTLILALITRAGIPPHLAAPWLTPVGHGVTAALVFLLGRRVGGLGVGLLAGALVGGSLPVFFRTGGMEIALLTALSAALALTLVRDDRNYWPGVLFGLLLLTRPDSVLLVLLILAGWAVRRRDWWRILGNGAVACAVYLPWALYALATFGDLVPSSIQAKLVPWTPSGAFGLSGFAQAFLPGPGQLATLCGWILFVGLGAAAVWKRLPALRPFIVWVPLYCIAMRWGRAADFKWYYVPPMWMAQLLLAVGMCYLIARMPRGARVPSGLLLVTVTLLLFGVHNWKAVAEVREHSPWLTFHKELALRVRAISKPGDLVASQEVGNLAYWSQRPVLDMLGLTSSAEVRLRAGSHLFGAMFRHWRPDWVVVHGIHDATLSNHYKPVVQIPYCTGRNYTIWKRLPDVHAEIGPTS
ncbi:MAG: hypothetical protein IMF16_09340 [Proteobacteria bacterium]|nr:hypothetical protein [Pseudomonadota bacterium]